MTDMRKFFPYLVVIVGLAMTAYSLLVVTSPCSDLGCFIQPVAWLGLLTGVDMLLTLGFHRLSHLALPVVLHFIVRILYLLCLALLITIALFVAFLLINGLFSM